MQRTSGTNKPLQVLSDAFIALVFVGVLTSIIIAVLGALMLAVPR